MTEGRSGATSAKKRQKMGLSTKRTIWVGWFQEPGAEDDVSSSILLGSQLTTNGFDGKTHRVSIVLEQDRYFLAWRGPIGPPMVRSILYLDEVKVHESGTDAALFETCGKSLPSLGYFWHAMENTSQPLWIAWTVHGGGSWTDGLPIPPARCEMWLVALDRGILESGLPRFPRAWRIELERT